MWTKRPIEERIINCYLKGIYKITCYKTNISQSFFFSLTAVWVFFLFPYEFVNFEKLIRFYWQAFIIYKNGENLKILKEIFRQKFIISNLILAFLDHPKPKIFFLGQLWWPTERVPFFKVSGFDSTLSCNKKWKVKSSKIMSYWNHLSCLAN